MVPVSRKNPYARRDASATWEAATTIRLTTIRLDLLVRYDRIRSDNPSSLTNIAIHSDKNNETKKNTALRTAIAYFKAEQGSD